MCTFSIVFHFLLKNVDKRLASLVYYDERYPKILLYYHLYNVKVPPHIDKIDK